jgi:hypothetical protein
MTTDRPATEAATSPRAQASRANGARSRGPATEAGKQRAARNAVRHGLWVKDLWIAKGEDPVEFASLHTALYDEWAPQGVVEATMVNELMMTVWRLRRLTRLEVERLRMGEGMADGQGTPPTMALLIRYRRELNKSLVELTAELEARRAARGTTIEEDLARLDRAAEELAATSGPDAAGPDLPAGPVPAADPPPALEAVPASLPPANDDRPEQRRRQ